MPVDELYFAGDREPPTSLDRILKRRYLAAEEDPPAEVLPASEDSATFTLPPGAEPRVTVEQVNDDRDSNRWQITVSGHTDRLLGGQPIRTLRRFTTGEISAQIDENKVDVEAFRPPWLDVAYSPPAAPDEEPPIRRLSRGFVRPMYVFGTDNRKPVYPKQWPWCCVGRVTNSNGKVGAGVLVGRNVVATAAHMVPWFDPTPSMNFVPAFYNVGSVFGPFASSSVIDLAGNYNSDNVCGYDWVVLRLSWNVGSWLGWFGYNGYTDDWEDESTWVVMGYPGAVGGSKQPSWQGKVSVVDDDSDDHGGAELEVSADITAGNSGGPLYGWFKGGTSPRVLGICSGEEWDWTERTNVFAAGCGFTNLITWARQNW